MNLDSIYSYEIEESKKIINKKKIGSFMEK